MKDRERLREDLSALARRGELSPAEARRFEVYLSASPVTAWLHRLGCEYDSTRTAEPGDEALLERAVERARARRVPVPARRAGWRPGPVIAAIVACSASAALAAVGVVHWARSGDAPGASEARDTHAPTRAALGAGAPAVSQPTPAQVIPSAARQTPEPTAGSRPAAPEVSASSAFERRAADAARQSPAELFSLANELRKAGRTSEAIAAYRRLQQEYPGVPEASVSHVLLGRILMRHEGPASAHEEFASYLARHPQGSLAEEALHGSAAALRALGRSADERRTLTTLLSRFPSSIYAGAARERLDELH